jgi:quercetin dioxygenase-like cupin family protein
MDQRSKYLLKLEDGRIEPLKDMEHCKRIVLIDKDTVGAEDITFAYIKYETKMAFHKRHVHKDAEEIIYIVSGKGMVGVGNDEFVAVKGDTIWVPRGEIHWVYNPFDEPLENLFLYTRATLESAGYEVVG